MIIKNYGLVLISCMAALLLAACGGGGDTPNGSATSQLLASSVVKSTNAGAMILSSKLNNPADPASVLSLREQVKNPRAVHAEVNTILAGQLESRLSRMGQAKGSHTDTLVGAVLKAAIPDPIAGCQSIELGYVYTDATPAAGYLKCYQFVVSGKSKIDTNVLMPTNVAAYGYLFAVDPITG